MDIQVIYTGGTIGMVPSDKGLVPGISDEEMSKWLNGLMEGSEITAKIRLKSLDHLIDSSSATPHDWQTILDTIEENPADSYVILHGTDTMSYTAAALSFARAGDDTPVVLTGSQLPLIAADSDAGKNVIGAITAAFSPKTKGVCLYFGDYLLAGNRSSKTSSWGFNGFETPLAHPLAIAGVPWRWAAQSQSRDTQPLPWGKPAPYRQHDVAMIDLVPGITAQRLRALLAPAPEAVIIRAYGMGNCPSVEPGFVDVLAETVASGVPVVISSQCQLADVALSTYEAGRVLARAGCVGSADMTLEATYAKLIFLLSQGMNSEQVRQWLEKPICGELS
ncbi:asparaginase [Propionimicrobium lymphophilum]|uniref:asparaginase n=1 Tax=Propionimicrobium lymphophilum TaxID=33012 RepID=UPI003EC855BF